MEWILRWLAAFALTQCVEMGIYTQAHPHDRPRRERLAIAFACSGVTHPIVWFAPREHFGGWVGYVLLAEAFAVIVEALWLRAFRVERALWWSLLANAASVAIGLAVRAALGE